MTEITERDFRRIISQIGIIREDLPYRSLENNQQRLGILQQQASFVLQQLMKERLIDAKEAERSQQRESGE